MQFSYVVPTRYENQTAADAHLQYNKNKINIALNVDKCAPRYQHAMTGKMSNCLI